MKKIDGVIFDMDGLLFDTELIYYQAQQKIADEMKFPYNQELYLAYVGVSDEEVQASYQEIFQEFGKEQVDIFIKRSYEETYRIFETGEVPLKAGVLDLLDYLEAAGIPKVVASSNQRPVIQLLLDKAGIRDRFSAIISAEDVQRAKPDPEIFIKALDTLATKAERTLVFEDSFHGVTAASQAQIPVIMVPDLILPTPEIEAQTETILSSLLDAPAYLAKK